MTPPPQAPLVRDAMPVMDGVDDDDFELDRDLPGQDGHRDLPVPEPEAQPLQRQGIGQRHVRRLDRGSDQQRGNRNSPSGDVIDIPAFLRKR
jgi:cell division protein FtsZ